MLMSTNKQKGNGGGVCEGERVSLWNITEGLQQRYGFK